MSETKAQAVPKMKAYRIPARIVAESIGAKEATVYAYRKDGKSARKSGPKAKLIPQAEELLGAGLNKLIEEVKRVVTV